MYCFGYIIQLWTVRFREARRHPMSSSPRSATLISLACVSSKTQSLYASGIFSLYLVHKMTVVVPGIANGDHGNWEEVLLCDRSHACFGKKT